MRERCIATVYTWNAAVFPLLVDSRDADRDFHGGNVLISDLSKENSRSARGKRVLFGLILVLSLAFAQAIHFHLDLEQGPSGHCALCVATHTQTLLTIAQLAPVHAPVSFAFVQHGEVSTVQRPKIFDLDIRPPPPAA